MWKICAKFVPRVLREDQKERRHDSREMVELINSDPAVLDALVTCDESWIYCYDPETNRQFPVEACWLSQTQEGQTEQIHPQTFDDLFFFFFFFWQHWHDLHTLGSHWTDSQQVILCWDFKGVQEEIPSEEASNWDCGISTRTMHQSTTPSLSQTIWPRWASRQFNPPIAQALLPVTFGYSLSSRKNLEAVIMRQLRRWKRL